MRFPRLIAAALAACLACSTLASAALAASVNVDVTTRINGRATVSNDLSSVRADLDESNLVQFAAGTGTGKADLLFTDERTIAASGTENLDLAGALTDPFGATVTFVKVKAILIEALASNTNSVVVFGAASNPFNAGLSGTTPKVTIEPGCSVLLVSKVGWTVTPATGDLILVANSGAGTAVTYRVTIIGASA